MNELSDEAVARYLLRGAEHEEISLSQDASEHLARRADGDARRALTALEVAAVLAGGKGSTVELNHAEQLWTHVLTGTARTNTTTLFRLSLRAFSSDVDASLYWLARMLEAGEDARFIARRLVILASEDIGMADPMSLLIADAAARAVDFCWATRGPTQPFKRLFI